MSNHIRTDDQTFLYGGVCVKNPRKRTGFTKNMINHIRRISLVILDLLFDHDAFYAVIGWFNQYLGLIESVFLVYPASDKYALAYVYRRRLSKVRWTPFLSGLLIQNGKLTLQFAISAHNGQFNNPANQESLRCMVDRMDHIRRLLHAPNKTFAGILPGVLHRKKIVTKTPEADVTARVVAQAVTQVIIQEEMGANVPIVILGGKGFIGKRVTELLSSYRIFSIDVGDDWPNHLRGQRIILVNITLKNILESYLERLWPEAVILNEVYPEPSFSTIERIKAIGCVCYHVAGVKALAFPSFPLAYRGGIPCCSAWNAERIRARVVRLV